MGFNLNVNRILCASKSCPNLCFLYRVIDKNKYIYIQYTNILYTHTYISNWNDQKLAAYIYSTHHDTFIYYYCVANKRKHAKKNESKYKWQELFLKSKLCNVKVSDIIYLCLILDAQNNTLFAYFLVEPTFQLQQNKRNRPTAIEMFL